MAMLIRRTGGNPAAGAQISETVPAGEVWKLLAVRFTLVTSATAATRTVTLTVDDGTNVLWRKIAPATQTATLTRNYLFLGEMGSADDAAFDANGDIKLSIPRLLLPAGYRVFTTLANGQAGDDYAAPLIHALAVTGSDDIEVEV